MYKRQTFNTPFYLQRSIEVNYSSFTAEWQIKGKSSASYNDVAAYTTYGTSRANAYKILEDSLNPVSYTHLIRRCRQYCSKCIIGQNRFFLLNGFAW